MNQLLISVSLENIYPITTTFGQDEADMSLNDVHLSVPHSLKEEVNIKFTLEDPRIPYESLLRDSGIDTDDVEIKHIIKLEPSGVLFDPAVSIRVSNFPAGKYLFVLHGTRDVDGFIEWEDVTDDVLAYQPDSEVAGEIRLLIKTFCRFATVRSRFNIVGRILDSLNCKFQTRSFAFFKRIPAFPQHFDTRVVFMSDEVYSSAYGLSQASDLEEKNYKECDSGAVKKMYTNRNLQIECEVFDTIIKTKKSVHISSSRLNRIGDVFDEFSNVEKPGIAKGKFDITQNQKGQMKHLWTLKFWEVSSKTLRYCSKV